MKFKLIFGIAIPALLIIALAIVASIGEVTQKNNYIKDIKISEIMTDSNIQTSIKIADIKLTNDNILPKRHELPNLGACLVDNEGNKQKIEAGNLVYSEGGYDYDIDPFESRRRYRSVEVKSNDELTIYIHLTPSNYLRNKDYNELLEQYSDYDELIVYENDDSSAYGYGRTISCYNLGQEKINESIHIKLIK